ncbi:MAG: DUF1801 domain-containing protein [Planctomycetia bacterium]
MNARPPTVAAWLAALSPERRASAEVLLATVRKHLPTGYAEGMASGMVAWHVPLSRYPAGYHCTPGQPLPFASLAATKAGFALHLFALYCAPRQREAFVRAWKASGQRLDMGAACVRVRDAGEVPLEVLGRALAALPVDTFVAAYEALLPAKVRERQAREAAAPAKASAKPKASTKVRPAAKPAARTRTTRPARTSRAR